MKLAYSINNILEEVLQKKNSSTHRIRTGCCDTPINNSDENHPKLPIQVVERDMADAIEEFKNSKETAFAHCISADFKSKKHMSAGVATVFKKKFGGPLSEDNINTHLSCQITSGAVVYGLITKTKYSHKPSIQDYDESFQQLLQDFQHKKLSHLICSPMGCVRDKIPLQHFVDKLITFQRLTGASVQIVSSEEKSSRTLRHGLTHPEFLRDLQRFIAQQYHVSSGNVPASPLRATALTTASQLPFQSTSASPGVSLLSASGSKVTQLSSDVLCNMSKLSSSGNLSNSFNNCLSNNLNSSNLSFSQNKFKKCI